MKVFDKIYPKGKYPVTIISGMNGNGKYLLMNKFAQLNGFESYKEKLIENRSSMDNYERAYDIFSFCKTRNKVVIHDIELYLHSDIQEKMIEFIFKINPNIELVITTQSPSIVIDGWTDKVIDLSELVEEYSHDKKLNDLYLFNVNLYQK